MKEDREEKAQKNGTRIGSLSGIYEESDERSAFLPGSARPFMALLSLKIDIHIVVNIITKESIID